MNIACIALLDNGNRMRNVARMLRDYAGIDATAYHGHHDTYLHIPDDTIQPIPKDITPIIDTADAVVTNDHTYVQYHDLLKGKPRLVVCNGTYARHMAPWLRYDYHKWGTLYVTSPLDWSLASCMGFSIQTLPPLVDTRLFPDPNQPDTGHLIIGHAATGPFKRTPKILELLQPYRKKHDVELKVWYNTPWHDNQALKAQCHIYIDQYQPTKGALGVSALEALWYGCTVLTNRLHPFTTNHYPDLPHIIHAFPEELIDTIKRRKRQIQPRYVKLGQDWLLKHFDLATCMPYWVSWLYHVQGDDYHA